MYAATPGPAGNAELTYVSDIMCPLMTIAMGTWMSCVEEKCALWISATDRCAVEDIAESLATISKRYGHE